MAIALDDLEVGLMFWGDTEPLKMIRAVKSLGIRCGHLGFTGAVDLTGLGEVYEKALADEEFVVTAVFAAYNGESYADIPTVEQTVGFIPVAFREEREARTYDVIDATAAMGVPTARLTLLAYVACSLLAGLGGMLFIFDVGSAQPSDFGNFYELYAIAAAVLGGCSLRGGSVSVVGIVLGTATLQVLRNSINLLGLGSQLEFAVIGAVLLAGVAADELVRRWHAARLERRGAG